MWTFVKHLRILGILGAILLLGPNPLIAEDLSNYQLVSVSSEHFYYNFELRNQQLFLGSDAGVVAYKDHSHIQVVDPAKKGYITQEKGEFVSYNYLKANIYAPQYKMLLPVGFRHSSILATSFKNTLLLLSKGQLFIYKKAAKLKADTLSIRAISPQYIGSYSGIFANGKRFHYPEYTNGYIRELPGETFICYDGLLRIRGNDTLRYESNGGNAQIGKTDIGKVKDVFKIDTTRYLLFSDKGLCISDLKSSVRWIRAQKEGPEPRFLKAFYRDGLPVVIYFIDGPRIQKYNLLNNAYTTLLRVEPGFGNIEDAYLSSTANLFLLTESKLLQAIYNLNANNYTFQTLVENQIGNHHIIPINTQLLITSNVGLGVYQIDTREWIPSLIKDEFNHRAVYITKDYFYLGTINGYYQLTKAQIEELISWRLEDVKLNSELDFESHETEIIYGLTALCVLLLSISIYLISRPSQSSVNHKAKAAEIIAFIDSNLKDVTIVNICHEFNINSLQLNDILGTDKPGELIRTKRLDLVRKMRLERRREEDIAQVTGFSVSYLKKIK